MSGVDLGAVIRAMPNLQGTRLLLATSGLAEHTGDHFDEVFAKPVRPSALLRALAKGRETEVPPAIIASPEVKHVPEEVKRLRVLVVEDNSINQKVTLGYLEKAGHRVDVASNGVEAVSAVRAFPYDLVLMDMQMPEMDGLSATRAIRALGDERSKVVIIGLTANVMEVDREACLGAGMDDYLPKPVERRSLLERVARWGVVRPRTLPPACRDSRTPQGRSAPPAMRSAPPPQPIQMDPLLMQDLVQSLGHEETRELLCSFRDSLRELADELPTLGREDLRSRAHRLAGSAGALGFEPVSLAAKSVDQTLREANDPASAIASLQILLESTVREMNPDTIESWLAAA
jgi:CheY-like chemotaxis protein